LSEELVDQIRKQGKKQGFATASAFMRAAIERELPDSETTLDGTEERLAATIVKELWALYLLLLERSGETRLVTGFLKKIVCRTQSMTAHGIVMRWKSKEARELGQKASKNVRRSFMFHHRFSGVFFVVASELFCYCSKLPATRLF
jgi:Arc/MetJ-type ribon-helix-helix transcriptional regulator